MLQDFLEEKDCLESLEELGFLGGLDSLVRKVRGGTLVLLACLLALFHQSSWRRETLETPEAAAFPASPDPEVTRVCQVYLVARVCLDFLVSLS